MTDRRTDGIGIAQKGQQNVKVSTECSLSKQFVELFLAEIKSTCSLAPPQHQGTAQGPPMVTRDTQDVGITRF